MKKTMKAAKKRGSSDRRQVFGMYVPNGTFSDVWCCDACGFRGTTGTRKALDGSEGFFCYKCAERGTTSPLRSVRVENETWVPGHTDVKCCGAWLRCDGFTNTCPHCGQDYNWNGHPLAPRELWGEETGEAAREILMGAARVVGVGRRSAL
jgi:hypothetical protein